MAADMTDSVAILNPSVNEAAYTVYKRWKRYAEFNDITQQIWMWLSENADSVATLEPPKLARAMRNAAERYCRKEKASRAGYESGDEYFYSINQLERLVWDAFDADAVPPTEGYRDDEQYSEWVTQVADVRAAIGKMPVKFRYTLREYTSTPDRKQDTAVNEALWRLRQQLGGSRPN